MPANIRTLVVGVQSKEGRPASVNLGPRTLIVGDNGRGKDRLTRALALSLTAGVDDLFGRGTAQRGGKPVRLVTDLALLMGPNDVLGLRAEALFDGDLGSATYALTRNGKGGTLSETHTLPQALVASTNARGEVEPHWWVMPVRTVQEALSRSPDKAAEFFLPYIAADVTQAAIQSALGGARWPAVESWVNEQDGGVERYPKGGLPLPVSLDSLLALTTATKERLKSLTARVEAATLAADTVTRGKVPVDAAVLVASQAALDEAKAALTMARAGTHATPGVSQAEYDALVNTVRSQETWIAAQEAALGPQPVAPIAPDVSALSPEEQAVHKLLLTMRDGLALLPNAAAAGVPHCPTCAQAFASQDAMATAYNAGQDLYKRIFAWKPNVAAVLNPVASTFAAESTAYLNANAAWSQGQAALHGPRQTLAHNRGRLSSMVVAVGSSATSTVSIHDAEARVATLQAAHNELVASAAAWETARGSQEGVRKAKILQSTGESVLVWLQEITQDLFKSSLQRFTASVQAYMPKGQTVVLSLDDGNGRRIFRAGLERGTSVDYALCGAEWTVVLLAVTSALLDRLPGGPPPFALLMPPEDRGWGATGLADAIRGLAKIPYQIVIVSTVAPRGKAPKAWTIIDLDTAAPLTGTETATPPATEETSTEEPSADAAETPAPAPAPVPAPVAAPTPSPAPQSPQDAFRDEQAQAALVTLGWKPDVIARMKPITRAKVLAESINPNSAAVLPNGLLHRF